MFSESCWQARPGMKSSRSMKARRTGTMAGRLAAGLASLCSLTIVFTGATQTLFSDNFDSFGSPVIVTNAVTTNGYNIKFNAPQGPQDLKVIFGFDYSTITYPTNI